MIARMSAACFLLVVAPTLVDAEQRTVRLLTVGNSFADNALDFLPEITKAAGHELVLGRANLGGCSLERHWNHVEQYEADNAASGGRPYRGGKYSLAEMLAQQQWDVITIQQVSFKSHDLKTYHPYVEKLYAYIRERAPEARILIHQIWAYRVDDKRFVPDNKGVEPHTQEVMYQQVRDAYHTVADELDIDIIPSGDAMYLADGDSKWGFRTDPSLDVTAHVYPQVPEQPHSLHKGWHWSKPDGNGKRVLQNDGHHASAAGCYLIGCVWFETIFGESCVANSFRPPKLDDAYVQFLQKMAHEAAERLEVAAPR